MTHPASADALFDEEAFERDESIPYWADLWPSAIALARFLSAEDLSGRSAVELGCGVGLPSVVALERGAARVVATDHYPGALDFAAYNVVARANAGANVEGKVHDFQTALLDWREPEVERFGDLDFDVLLAADVLYERRNVPLLLDLVPRLLSRDGEILLADPRRPGADIFIAEIEKAGFRVVREERIEVEQSGREVSVIVYAIRRRESP